MLSLFRLYEIYGDRKEDNPMKIYCNGDSHTSGRELSSIGIPGFPGFKSNIMKINKDWNLKEKEYLAKVHGSFAAAIEFEKTLAWPSVLRKSDPNIHLINASKPGASNEGILMRTASDLLDAKIKNIQFDLVFIQLTSIFRIFQFDTEGARDNFNDYVLSDLSVYPAGRKKDIAELISEVYSLEDYALKNLYTIFFIKKVVKDLTNRDPIFVGSFKFWIDEIYDAIQKNSKLNKMETINNLITETGILDIVDYMNYESFNDLKTSELKLMPGNHFLQEEHNKFGEHIYKKYILNNSTIV